MVTLRCQARTLPPSGKLHISCLLLFTGGDQYIKIALSYFCSARKHALDSYLPVHLHVLSRMSQVALQFCCLPKSLQRPTCTICMPFLGARKIEPRAGSAWLPPLMLDIAGAVPKTKKLKTKKLTRGMCSLLLNDRRISPIIGRVCHSYNLEGPPIGALG
jgi:hypothetical protein